jgi:peptidylprolyl isomerase
MKFCLRIAICSALIVPLAGCGGSSEGEASSSTTVASHAQPSPETPVQAYSGDWTALKKVAGKYSDRLLIPKGPSPDHVVIRDLKVGTGPAISPGESFVSHYISFDYETGKAFEPYWGQSAGSLAWGKDERVMGWEPGLKGVREGGIRELIVPAKLAYGNDVLVYVVAIDKIERSQ